jgi:hypothetical protein
MKRLLIGLAAGVVGGTVFGFGLGIFVYPFWFLQGTAMERLADTVARTAVAEGRFVHVNVADPVHWGKGTTTLYREGGTNSIVFLHEDFEVGPGPRFHVYLVDHPSVRSGSDFEASRQIDLGRLHAFRGSQIYAVPQGTDLGLYKSVVIWCKEFGVLISPASLAAGPEKLTQVSDARRPSVPPRVLRNESRASGGG